MSRRSVGAEWEGEALRRLEAAGLGLVERNYTTRLGELDLVMDDGETLVFVEVRFRKRRDFGSGADSVSPHKQRRLINAARHYLQKYPAQGDRPCRFDVVSIGAAGAAPQVEWIRNAFTLDDA